MDTGRRGHRSRLLTQTKWARCAEWMRRRPGLMIVAGLSLGALAVGVCLLLLHFVIQPFSRPETKGYVTYPGEHFKLWYADDSQSMDGHTAMHATLEREYRDLVALMEISETLIEEPVDVFVHDSIPAMQESIMRRKSYTVGAVFERPFDVLAGTSPRRALAEVLLYLAWGECFSSAIYTGVLEFVANPEAPYLSVVKAAPDERAHSIAELCVLEAGGTFTPTMYQSLTGPTSTATLAAYVQLKDVRAFFLIPESLAASRSEDLHRMEAASLVQFLIAEYEGFDVVRRIWGTGGLAVGLRRADPERSLEDLEDLWQTAIRVEGDTEHVPTALRAKLLLEGGFAEEAYRMIQDWDADPSGCSSEDCATAARSALAVGAFDAALPWIEALDESVRGEYEELWETFAGWAKRETGELVLLAADDAIDEALARVESEYQFLCRRLGTSLLETSEVRPAFFVYPDTESRDVGARIGGEDPTAVFSVHLVLDEDPLLAMTESLLPRLWGWRPASPLVRIGVLTALLTERSELVEQGASLYCSQAWQRVSGLAVGTTSEQILELEIGLLVSEVESIGGLDGIRALWTAGQERGRVSLETALRSVVGLGVRELEDHILVDVISCD